MTRLHAMLVQILRPSSLMRFMWVRVALLHGAPTIETMGQFDIGLN